MTTPDEGQHPDVAALARYRHASVRDIARYFTSDHPCDQLAAEMLEQLPDSAQLTAGLRKLLEAKDCFVRAALNKP